jgi:hypothetical protein
MIIPIDTSTPSCLSTQQQHPAVDSANFVTTDAIADAVPNDIVAGSCTHATSTSELRGYGAILGHTECCPVEEIHRYSIVASYLHDRAAIPVCKDRATMQRYFALCGIADAYNDWCTSCEAATMLQ